eukprot:scaffold328016_cov27-Prasinocladus_malaysianus.AAC.1
MGVCLVADVKDELVVRAVEDVMHGDGELDHAEARPQVAARLGHDVDELGADLLAEGLQLVAVEVFQVDWVVDGVQEGRWRPFDVVPAVEVVLGESVHHVGVAGAAIAIAVPGGGSDGEGQPVWDDGAEGAG